MRKLIDANVILRYFLGDDENMSAIACTQIKAGAFTVPEVIAEVVYVLKRVYKVERDKIVECLSVLLDEVDFSIYSHFQPGIELHLPVLVCSSFDFAFLRIEALFLTIVHPLSRSNIESVL